MRSFRDSGQSFRHRAGWLLRLLLIALAIGIGLALIAALVHAH
jgi:hypothetical protein